MPTSRNKSEGYYVGKHEGKHYRLTGFRRPQIRESVTVPSHYVASHAAISKLSRVLKAKIQKADEE